MRSAALPWVISVLLYASTAHAGQATVAVATNFKIPAQALIDLFHQQQPQHRIRLVSGSTGKLFTQIMHGAPFDVFLAADVERPARLESNGTAVVGTRRTYAVGQLALLGQAPTFEHTLKGEIDSLAMANPQLAPYGLAAQQTLAELGVEIGPRVKVVYGENVGQAYAMVASGNAELGLIARSMLQPSDRAWLVPSHLHTPIRQQLVLLQRAADNDTALAFLAYLNGADASAAIEAFGYLIETS